MSAISVFGPEAHHFDLPRSPASADPKSSGNRAAADWQLTNRGIAVVMVIAAMILTAAIAVIGITAVRVTSPDGDARPQESRQAQH